MCSNLLLFVKILWVKSSQFSIGIRAFGCFAWERQSSSCRFRSCSNWSWKFTTSTNKTKLLGLKVTLMWAVLYSSLTYWPMDLFRQWNVTIHIKLKDCCSYSPQQHKCKMCTAKFTFKSHLLGIRELLECSKSSSLSLASFLCFAGVQFILPLRWAQVKNTPRFCWNVRIKAFVFEYSKY